MRPFADRACEPAMHRLNPTTQAASMPATTANMRYVLITPCRDEADTAHRTLESVVNQSVPPALWIIVDDGSTDGTPQILEQYAKRYPFIEVQRREDRGRRSVGPGVVDAFYAGLQHVNLERFDYICKLDLDLDLPERYFETLMHRMAVDPQLGTCSGKPYCAGRSNTEKRVDGELVPEPCGDEMSVGMSKFYSVECFRAIGGFVREVMWDGIDCHRCRMLGWSARSWDEPTLRFIHLRPMGSSYRGVLTGRMRHGYGQYYMGTGWAYITASAVYRMLKQPRMIGGLGIWWGYAQAWLRGRPRYPDRAFRRFLRRYQRACLWRGKRRATQRLEKRLASIHQTRQHTQADTQCANEIGPNVTVERE